ncbi:MAG: cbb3-type cytochrome c oxidase subunit I [Gammaproteobacteria bacterium]|nr:cbb3-type cytochrome c oxidase subunit I [Gammaproteobacteria bacterium]
MRRWFTTDHETVGTLYLLLSAVMLLVAGAAALVVRAELFEPGLAFLAPAEFNRAVTAHGMFAVFGVLFPACAGLASRMVPAMIRAREMAFPRANAVSFWLLVPAFALFAAALFGGPGTQEGGDPGVGRWPAVPAGHAVTFALGVLLVAVSWVLCGWNVAATVWWRRSRTAPLARLPVFARTMALAAATWFVLGATLALWALTLVNASVGAATAGGAPAAFRYGFWFLGHPASWLVVVPVIGVVTEVLSRNAKRPPFGADAIVQATGSLAGLALLAWLGEMVLDKSLAGELFFLYVGMLAAVPAAVIAGNWAATLWRRSFPLDASACFALAAALFLALGAGAGVFLPLASVAAGSAVEAAHTHYLFVGFGLFGLFAGVYRWLPAWTGGTCDETLGRVHFWLSFVGLNATFLPQYLAGASGMLRRIPDYPLTLADLNAAATAGGFLLGFAQLLFVFVALKAVLKAVRPSA